MVAKGVEPNVVTYTALIHGHAKNGDMDAAFWLQKEMEEKGIYSNAITVSVLVDGLCRENRVQDAVRFIMEYSGQKKSEKNPSIANSVTYMTLIYGLYIDGQYNEACYFFSCMRDSGMVPDRFTYTLVIRGLCMLGYVLNAMMLYADMVKVGVKPTKCAMVCPDIWSRESVDHRMT
jgi:pentatricopeptide repeat protein